MARKLIIKDTGQREHFSTGAQRDVQTGKGRYDLIPPGPLFRLARIYEDGAVKYDDDNWRKGIPMRRFLDSAERHLQKFKAGYVDEDHLAQAAWNIFGLMWTEAAVASGMRKEELLNIPAEPSAYGNGFRPDVESGLEAE